MREIIELHPTEGMEAAGESGSGSASEAPLAEPVDPASVAAGAGDSAPPAEVREAAHRAAAAEGDRRRAAFTREVSGFDGTFDEAVELG